MPHPDYTITHEIGERLFQVLFVKTDHQFQHLEALLQGLHAKVNEMKTEISDLRAKVDSDNAQIKTALSNIAADEARQAQQIADLIAQVGAGAPLDQADLDNLKAIGDTSASTAAALQQVADSIPEPTPPPVEG